MSEQQNNTFDSWDQLMEEFGNTEEELDALFDEPWPGQYGYEDDDPENDPDEMRYQRERQHP